MTRPHPIQAGSADDGDEAALGLAKLQQRLQIARGQRTAIIKAPPGSPLRLTTSVGPAPDGADVVIGFAARPADIAGLRAVFTAACRYRVVWLLYPRPGRAGTDLRREWLVRALSRHGVTAVDDVPVDHAWSALRLAPAIDGRPAVRVVR